MNAAAVADTQSDLLAITQNVDRKTRAAVRKAVSDSMRLNMTKGTNGRRSITDLVRKSVLSRHFVPRRGLQRIRGADLPLKETFRWRKEFPASELEKPTQIL